MRLGFFILLSSNSDSDFWRIENCILGVRNCIIAKGFVIIQNYKVWVNYIGDYHREWTDTAPFIHLPLYTRPTFSSLAT